MAQDYWDFLYQLSIQKKVSETINIHVEYILLGPKELFPQDIGNDLFLLDSVSKMENIITICSIAQTFKEKL